MVRVWVLVLALISCYVRYASAEAKKPAAKPATKVQSPAKAATKQTASVVPGAKPSILNTPIRKPATLDPNSSIEVRGQARTLSMMLVLKNGKDGINFIKVRKDYHPEILNTDF